MPFSKREWEKNLFQAVILPLYAPSCFTPGGHQEILLWDLLLQASVEHKYIFFTVTDSRVQLISQDLHFSTSYDGFGSGMKTFSSDSCNSLRDFGNVRSFIWKL